MMDDALTSNGIRDPYHEHISSSPVSRCNFLADQKRIGKLKLLIKMKSENTKFLCQYRSVSVLESLRLESSSASVEIGKYEQFLWQYTSAGVNESLRFESSSASV